MIVWSGLGWLIPAFCIIGTVLMYWITGEASYQNNGWPKLLGLLIGAGFTYGLHLYLSKQPVRELLDPETGQTIVFKRRDSLFFTPVKYWPFIIIALAFLASFL